MTTEETKPIGLDNKFFDFRELFAAISDESNTDPIPIDEVRRFVAYTVYTRFGKVASDLIEHRTEVLKTQESNFDKNWSEIKAIATRQCRRAAAEEILPEIEGFTGNMLTRDFAIYQNRKRRDLLQNALKEQGIELRKNSVLASRYISGIVGYPLKEVVRRYIVSWERNQNEEYRARVMEAITAAKEQIESESTDLRKRRVRQQVARKTWQEVKA